MTSLSTRSAAPCQADCEASYGSYGKVPAAERVAGMRAVARRQEGLPRARNRDSEDREPHRPDRTSRRHRKVERLETAGEPDQREPAELGRAEGAWPGRPGQEEAHQSKRPGAVPQRRREAPPATRLPTPRW